MHTETPFPAVRSAKEIGALIRELRRLKKITQDELAQRVGTSRLWITQVERGKPSAQIGLILRTLRELGITLCPISYKHIRAEIDLGEIVKNPGDTP